MELVPDDTYVRVIPTAADRVHYRNRKGDHAFNVLGVCNPRLQFIYVLSGWKGSVTDSRVLRDALGQPNEQRIPFGQYYLADRAYTNGEGFLTPYRGQRYHLNEWRVAPMPNSQEEYFNMKHSVACNVIKRCFGVLKMRWTIL